MEAVDIYTSEKLGSHESGDGSPDKPFKTVMQGLRKAGKEPFPTIYVDSKEDEKFETIAKSQLKKITKLFKEYTKLEERLKKENEDEEKRSKVLEEAKKVKITEDKTLPPATLIKIKDGEKFRTKRVKVHGWVHGIRRQGKSMMFNVLRDGSGFL